MFKIQKKTPASNFYTIHDEIEELETTHYLLECVYTYDNEQWCLDLNRVEENEAITTFGTASYFDKGGDLIEYRIIEA